MEKEFTCPVCKGEAHIDKMKSACVVYCENCDFELYLPGVEIQKATWLFNFLCVEWED